VIRDIAHSCNTFKEQGTDPIPSHTDFMAKEPRNPLFFYQQLPGAGDLSVVTVAWHEIVGSLWRNVF